MAEKNRFSKLLKHLMSVADVKNYTLAQELQYDVSYISKWTSGQMIPSEKNEKKILKGISECVVNGCGEDAQKRLQADYQVVTCEAGNSGPSGSGIFLCQRVSGQFGSGDRSQNALFSGIEAFTVHIQDASSCFAPCQWP